MLRGARICKNDINRNACHLTLVQKRDTNVNATLSDGTSALQVAAELGHATIVERYARQDLCSDRTVQTRKQRQQLSLMLFSYRSLIIAGSDLDYGSPDKLPAVLAATNVRVFART